MAALQRMRFYVPRRDVGAGLVIGTAALLANVLFYAVWSVLWGYNWFWILGPALVLTPVTAVVTGTVVWRVVLSDDPTPLRGAGAGVVTAVLSLLGFALVFGVISALSDLFRGAPSDALTAFLFMAFSIFVFGGLLTVAIIVPIGAAVGYGYEWYLARRWDDSVGSERT